MAPWKQFQEGPGGCVGPSHPGVAWQGHLIPQGILSSDLHVAAVPCKGVCLCVYVSKWTMLLKRSQFCFKCT